MRPDAPAMSVDVVVPTYLRPDPLDRCLSALTAQERPADRVLVVARADDVGARRVVEAHLERVTVAQPGVLAAMAAGVATSTGAVLAFTDDDAAPRPEWIAKLIDHFGDPTVGAVGGRDVIAGQEAPLTDDVGRLRRSGRLSGMHHLGTGPPRGVDVLKGVNMAFRAEALALPGPGVLRGSGAQVDFEIITCAWAKRQGWRLVYDPAIQVDHTAAPRIGSDQRERPAPSAVADAAFNSVIAASAVGRCALVRHASYGLLVGTRDRPGLVRALVGWARDEEEEVIARLRPALAGRASALLHARRELFGSTGPRVQTAMELRRTQRLAPRLTLVAHDIHDDGGMERAFAELVRATCADFDITVISSTLADDLRPLVHWHRVGVPQRPFLAKFAVFFALAGLAVGRERGDLVHTLGAIVPNRADVVTLQFCHAGFRAATGSLTPVGAPALRRLNSGGARLVALCAERWCYRPRRLVAFAAVSSGVRQEAEEHYPGIPVALTPNGVDPARFMPDEPGRSTTRRAAGVGDETSIALFVGGDWDRKGLALAIEGLAKARADGADLVLWVVGSGDQGRFEGVASASGVGEAVTFFGRRHDTEIFYRAADLFVLPTSYETFSLVCFEAAASGLPLVIPSISGAGELVGDDEAGIIIGLDADSIARTMRTLALDRELRDVLGAEGQRRASSFTWENSTAAVAALYSRLLPQAPS